MKFTYLAAERTSHCLVFLLKKTHDHSSRHHVSSCNFLFFRKHPFSSIKPTSGDADGSVGRSSSSPSSPTVSYLIEKCGLSTKTALSVSKKFELRSVEKSDSMLRFFREYDLTDEQISSLIVKCPRILSFGTDGNLKPKLEFLLSEGFTRLQVVEIMLSNPSTLLNNNLERRIIPCINFMKTILPTNAAITKFLKSSTNIVSSVQLANVEILRRNGAPDSVITKMYTSFPRSMTRDNNWFAKGVEKAMDLGIEPSEVSKFSNLVGVLSYMSPSTWERKMMLYKSMGWSTEETLLLFKTHPFCFRYSDKLTKKKLEFFLHTLRYSPKRLISYPNLFRLSLEKRIRPRCSVLGVLIAKGLIKTISLSNLMMSEDKFLGVFVAKYKDCVPEVEEAHNGKLHFKGLFPKWWNIEHN
ncbi:hypothetical protein ZOSMA_33G00050 [Zostera marina]|uniref:Mitochondrial transcription termination factor family protein n=1 Tax=Zostera marina TaxID=29655 RepID=A0A0K9P9N7_ZOSMR|nr:hypothetical protein ZOSMA_33G00050 [Zostera marina]